MEKIYVEFPGDPTVGISGYGFTMEVPKMEPSNWPNEEAFKQEREELRGQIQNLYQTLDGEFYCKVYFENEMV